MSEEQVWEPSMEFRWSDNMHTNLMYKLQQKWICGDKFEWRCIPIKVWMHGEYEVDGKSSLSK